MKKKIDNTNIEGLIKNTGKNKNRLLIGSPMVGLVRAEWVAARYNQTIPTNWSALTITQFMSSMIPLDFQIADAYNLIAKAVVENDVEWLITIEHDNVIPPNGFVKMNEYMIEFKIPIVSSIYFTKSIPPEPILYRGIGNGHYDKWKFGDKVWVSGIPMGFTLIHGSIIKAIWNESSEYIVNNQVTRRVFETPNALHFDPETRAHTATSGTQDLEFCKRIMEGNFLEKAGWGDFAKKHKENPFLVDTTIFCRHISQDGIQFPVEIPQKFIP